jgi:hypothetical protein
LRFKITKRNLLTCLLPLLPAPALALAGIRKPCYTHEQERGLSLSMAGEPDGADGRTMFSHGDAISFLGKEIVNPLRTQAVRGMGARRR